MKKASNFYKISKPQPVMCTCGLQIRYLDHVLQYNSTDDPRSYTEQILQKISL